MSTACCLYTAPLFTFSYLHTSSLEKKSNRYSLSALQYQHSKKAEKCGKLAVTRVSTHPSMQHTILFLFTAGASGSIISYGSRLKKCSPLRSAITLAHCAPPVKAATNSGRRLLSGEFFFFNEPKKKTEFPSVRNQPIKQV